MNKTDLYMKTRFSIFLNLVFCLLAFSCSERHTKDQSIIIHWNGNHAISLDIPRSWLPGTSNDSIREWLQVSLENSNTRILGDYQVSENIIAFRPLVHFTPGLKYRVVYAGKLLEEIKIPEVKGSPLPEIISIFPTTDTIPENLLKIHIEFSKPMQEGQAMDHIVVIKDKKDTVPVFLDLELWNTNRTILTVWLDPGRIKRDLQPNKKSGPPLQSGSHYLLQVKNDWRDAEGVSLPYSYQKEFVTGSRDSLSPDPAQWRMDIPVSGTRVPLKIFLGEALDYVLLKNTARFLDTKGNSIDGATSIENKESVLLFTPLQNWHAGDYTIEIESRLEDLAGNNLNRLFDRDLAKKDSVKQANIYRRRFQVQ
ncbi:MAG TPA: Ig-like domain-containing protein [Chitinophagaceae bacterium]|nr:Ig-like domain-containing protein [Chitinophagaceae bacterium]